MNCKHCEELVIISEEATLWIQHVFNFLQAQETFTELKSGKWFFFFFYRLVTSQKHFLTLKEASNDFSP